jgi:hypothetical protein
LPVWWTGEPFPRHGHPSSFFSRALQAQLKNARKRFFFREMEFPSRKIAAVAPYTPPRPITLAARRSFFDKQQRPLRKTQKTLFFYSSNLAPSG